MKRLFIIALILVAGIFLGWYGAHLRNGTTVVQKEPDHGEIPAVQKPVSLPVSLEPVATQRPDSGPRKQLVLLSFDGSYSQDMWDKTLAFAEKMRGVNKPLSFTYFISGVYFLSYKDKLQYHPPGHDAGESTIGFGLNESDIAERIKKVNQAVDEGHEIGTHFNGHYDGSHWTLGEWESELAQFLDFVFAPGHDLRISRADIRGARTPLLGINAPYFALLHDKQFLYDASMTGKADQWPKRTAEGIWELSLAQIEYVPTKTKILSMDYNFYFKQTGGVDKLIRDTPEWNAAYFAMLDSYKKYFNANYNGTRAPVIIGHHFSLWNDGVYWDALKQFAWDVCGLPDVECTTFSKAVEYLNN